MIHQVWSWLTSSSTSISRRPLVAFGFRCFNDQSGQNWGTEGHTLARQDSKNLKHPLLASHDSHFGHDRCQIQDKLSPRRRLEQYLVSLALWEGPSDCQLVVSVGTLAPSESMSSEEVVWGKFQTAPI
jgi:hypothetical protein